MINFLISSKMRIIVRYCLPWGNFSTQAIDIEPNATVETLQAKIFEKFNIPIRRQLIKFKRDGFSVIAWLCFPHSFIIIVARGQWLDIRLL
mgnify:CR=1 FL=1